MPYIINPAGTGFNWKDPSENYQLQPGETSSDTEPVIVPSHAAIAAGVLAYARTLREKLFTVVDGLQASALALDNSSDATSIETFKAGLRNITKIDLSAATTEAQMKAVILAQYKTLAAAAPPSVQLAFVQAIT